MKKNILLIFLLAIGIWSFAQDTSCSLGLEVSSVQAEVGEIVTIDITSRQFNNILGLQYTHQWNPAELEFVDIVFSAEGPQGLNVSSFGNAEGGNLGFAFANPFGQGGVLTDNAILYSIRFVYLQAVDALVQVSGSQVGIELIEQVGSSIEASNNYYFVAGVVTPAGGATLDAPSINSACLTNLSCGNATGGEINIDVTGNDLTFQWEGPNGFTATSESIADLAIGHYTLELTGGNQQSTYADFYIGNSVDLGVTLVIDNDECGGAADGTITTTVGGGSGNYAYAWSNGATTANIDNLDEGTYSLIVTDNDTGCIGTAQVNVGSVVSIWIVGENLPTSCLTAADGSIDITVDAPAGYAPFTYEWSNGATTEDIAGLAGGWYEVTVTGSNGCSSTFAAGVTIEVQPVLDVTIVQPNCVTTSSGSIALDIEEEASFDILWTTGATTATIDGLEPGIYGVSLTNQGSACTYEYEYTMTSITEVSSTYTYYDCDGESTEIQLSIWDHSDAPYTVDWSTGEQTTTNPLGLADVSSVFITENGTYSVIITGASGCTYTAYDFVIDCINNPINLNLTPAQSTVDAGATVCLDVNIDEFENIGAFQFTLAWDESLLAFTELNNINVPEFNSGNYNVNLIDDGLFVVSWNDINGQGVDLSSSPSLFTVCFDAISGQEVTTTVSFESFPTPTEFIVIVDGAGTEKEVNTSNALITLNGGVIASEGELNLSIGEVEINQGGIACVPVSSSEFHRLGGLQFSMAWGTEALIFNNVRNVNLPAAGFNSIAESQEDGVLRLVWTSSDPNGIYLAENSTLFEVCFTAQGEEGIYPVSFSEQPIPAIAGNIDGEMVDLNLEDGSVTIGEQVTSNETSLSIATVAVDAGASICVPIYADNIVDLVAMQFSIIWDEELITFDRVELLDNALNLSEIDFNTPEGGVFVLAWYSSSLVPVNLAAGTPVFELCFTAGQQQAVAGINFSNEPVSIEFINSSNELMNFIPVNGQITITTDELVWPGDTDVNTVVNHFDLLNVGLAYGAQGAARNNASMNWLGQYVQPWEQNTPLSNVDYRFVDADGNGEINADDVQVIIQNWDQTTEEYTTSDGSSRELEVEAIPFYVQPATVEAGTSVSLPIILGTEEDASEDVYGVAFSITYDPALVRPESAQIIFDGWLGAEAEVLGIYRDYHGYGRIDVAMVRTDGQNVSGQGEIGSFAIIVEDVIFRDEIDLEMLVSIENVRLINAGEEEILTSPVETVVLVQNVTGTKEAFELQGLQVSPNPTTASFKIEHTNVAIQSMTIFDSRGQLQQGLEVSSDTYNVEQLPAGVYWLRFQTDKGVAVRKLIKL